VAKHPSELEVGDLCIGPTFESTQTIIGVDSPTKYSPYWMITFSSQCYIPPSKKWFSKEIPGTHINNKSFLSSDGVLLVFKESNE